MSQSAVTREGLKGVRPGRAAPVDDATSRHRRRRGGGEQPTVPEADFRSYYGLPVINKPVWSATDIGGYLFLGGLAGASSVIAALADLRGEKSLARTAKVGAASAISLSFAALVHDLGRPERFINMLRVFKPTSPMSVGSWLLSAYAPASAAAAAASLTGRLRLAGGAATVGAAALGPAVASYTAVLISDTAVPAWHDGYRELPFVFVGSSASAAGGLCLMAAPRDEQDLPRRAAVFGLAVEFAAAKLMERRMGDVAEPYHTGKGGQLMRAGQVLGGAGGALALLSRRRRGFGRLGGALLLASSACTRLGIFAGGMASAEDPKYTVKPQRERAAARSVDGRVG
jgi:hypothetical protein